MRSFVVSGVVLFFACAGMLVLEHQFQARLWDPVFMTGWCLVIVMALQIVMRLRAKQPGRFAGRATTWRLIHVVTGIFGVFVFALHTSSGLPDTALEWALWIPFVIIASSGIAGFIVLKVSTNRLAETDTRLPFEQIPEARRQLAHQAAATSIESLERTQSDRLAQLYADRLHSYFQGPRHLFAHLTRSQLPMRRLTFQIDQIGSTATTAEQAILSDFRDMIEKKFALDFRYANELLAKAWLLVHLTASYVIIVLTVVHVLIAYAFTSAAPPAQ
ncbi:MAG: hypothetical protein AAGC70_05185 [Pseudomonadota bacterium]